MRDTSDHNNFFNHLWLAGLLLFLCLSGCVAGKPTQHNSQTVSAPPPLQKTSHPNAHFGTVAVAKVKIDQPGARLVFKDSGVSDKIVRHLKQTGQFKVIDWTNLDDILLRRNLQWSDLTDDENVSNEIRKVLLNDYFLIGNVTSYGDRMDFSSSAFSKSKTQTVTTTVELSIKDALTNEILATGRGQGESSKNITQTLGFGAAGGNDTILANKTLEMAIDQGVANLIRQMPTNSPPHRDLTTKTENNKRPAELYRLSPELKVLFLFAEEEETEDGSIKEKKSSTLGLSIAENAMAKEFHKTGCQVLTAGDVVGKAYSVAGGEDILQTGWVTEEELFELENLLQARTGLASYAIKVGKTSGADIVVTGTIRHQTSTSTLSKAPGAKLSSTYLSAKAIKVNSKKVLHMSEVLQDYMAIQSPNRLKAQVKVLTIAAKKAAGELIEAVSLSEK